MDSSSNDLTFLLSSKSGRKDLKEQQDSMGPFDLNDGGELDNELASIQAQVDDTELTLQNIQRSIKDKTERYAIEINDLQEQLAQAKLESQRLLQEQEEQQNNEITDLKLHFNDEVSKIQGLLNRNIQEDNEWMQKRTEINQLGNETQLNDLLHKMETDKAKFQESVTVSAGNEARKKMERISNSIAAESRMRQLETEVADIQSNRRELGNESRLKTEEFNDKLEVRNRDHQILMRKMTNEMNVRTAQYEQHIKSLQSRLTREKQQCEFELRAATDKCENLQKMYQTITKRGSQQLLSITKDIERMKRSLDEAQKGESKYDTNNRSQMLKNQTLNAETENLRRTYQLMQEEFERLQMENQLAMHELQKCQQSNSTSYSSRRPSGFSSSFRQSLGYK